MGNNVFCVTPQVSISSVRNWIGEILYCEFILKNIFYSLLVIISSLSLTTYLTHGQSGV